jgi:hypothetical protein
VREVAIRALRTGRRRGQDRHDARRETG